MRDRKQERERPNFGEHKETTEDQNLKHISGDRAAVPRSRGVPVDKFHRRSSPLQPPAPNHHHRHQAPSTEAAVRSTQRDPSTIRSTLSLSLLNRGTPASVGHGTAEEENWIQWHFTLTHRQPGDAFTSKRGDSLPSCQWQTLKNFSWKH